MILFTGLTGRSGSALYDVLCREKYTEKIRVVVRKTTDLSMFDHSPLDLEFVYGDITDVDFLTDAMRGCDKVFHIAHKQRAPYIAEAVLRSAEIRHVIFVSSTIVYSAHYPTLTLKQDEAVIRRQFDERGIHYVFLRPTMIFGTTNDQNISQFIRWFKKYPIFPIVGYGKATIQPVCRLDLAEAYWTILKNLDSLQQTEYIISGKESMELRKMFEIITSEMGKQVRFVNIPFSLAKFCVNCVYYLSFRRIDFREKLDRLMEDRAYPHTQMALEFGYCPLSFRQRVTPLIRAINSDG